MQHNYKKTTPPKKKNLRCGGQYSYKKALNSYSENVTKQLLLKFIYNNFFFFCKMIQWFGFNIGLFLRCTSCFLFLLLFCMNFTFQMGKNSWTMQTLSFSLVKCTKPIKNNPQFKWYPDKIFLFIFWFSR